MTLNLDVTIRPWPDHRGSSKCVEIKQGEYAVPAVSAVDADHIARMVSEAYNQGVRDAQREMRKALGVET